MHSDLFVTLSSDATRQVPRLRRVAAFLGDEVHVWDADAHHFVARTCERRARQRELARRVRRVKLGGLATASHVLLTIHKNYLARALTSPAAVLCTNTPKCV